MNALTFSLATALLSFGLAMPVAKAANDPQTAIDAFQQSMLEQGFEADFVRQTLAAANKNPAVLEAIQRPWEAKPWHQYYPIFLTEKRLEKGLAFWQEHADVLARAEQELGVPAHIVVAILGVETFYGGYKGKYPVLDALYTLAFYYPPRSKFFTSELGEYLRLIQEENFAATELKGSYAGAMGWGQFISSSYRHYAIDFDGDGVRDLLNNPVDAIGSVANYFRQHGWRSGEPVAFPATTPESVPGHLISTDLTYQHQWSQLQTAGIAIEGEQLDAEQSVKLLRFEQPNGQEYWVGLPNFYVITRYNHSPLYAMVVYQLAEQLRGARQ